MRHSLLAACLSVGALRCGDPGALPAHCEAIEVDALRELVVTDAAVVGRSELGFTRVMGNVLGPNANVAARAWTDLWSAMPGESSLDADVVQPWSNGDASSVDLSMAPFELIAVSNRVDFFVPASAGRMGEMRFVYGLVTQGTRQPLTVIVELQLPPTRTPAGWAQAWHALGSLSGDAYGAAVLAIANEVLAQPLHGQVRAQDGRIAPPRLAEFDIVPGAPLAVSNLANTPAPDVDPGALASFAQTHETDILAGDDVLPQSMLTPFAATTRPAPLTLPGVDPAATDALVASTCAGCHTTKPTLDGTFHVSPLQRGAAALSPFLTDSSAGPSELDRRAEVLRGLLCQ